MTQPTLFHVVDVGTRACGCLTTVALHEGHCCLAEATADGITCHQDEWSVRDGRWLPGILGRYPWRVQCAECGRIGQHPRYLSGAIADGGIHFHHTPWPDGSNPRLCAACRVKRGCECWDCERDGRVA